MYKFWSRRYGKSPELLLLCQPLLQPVSSFLFYKHLFPGEESFLQNATRQQKQWKALSLLSAQSVLSARVVGRWCRVRCVSHVRGGHTHGRPPEDARAGAVCGGCWWNWEKTFLPRQMIALNVQVCRPSSLSYRFRSSADRTIYHPLPITFESQV